MLDEGSLQSPMAFGKNLSRILLARGISQREFAAMMGLSPQAISRWVNGVDEPSHANFLKAARLLNLDPSRMADSGGAPDPEDQEFFDLLRIMNREQKRMGLRLLRAQLGLPDK